jgi:hypothetical protein
MPLLLAASSSGLCSLRAQFSVPEHRLNTGEAPASLDEPRPSLECHSVRIQAPDRMAASTNGTPTVPARFDGSGTGARGDSHRNAHAAGRTNSERRTDCFTVQPQIPSQDRIPGGAMASIHAMKSHTMSGHPRELKKTGIQTGHSLVKLGDNCCFYQDA